MSFESQLYEADEEVQMAHATTGEITRRLRATLVASSLNYEYDVFLSFRGSDTRKKFTDHLYKALKLEGYRIFRDEDEIEPGENIKSELREAIRNSWMSVIVLSENYANSTACLFELQTILEYQRKSGHMIFPVFYDVDPSQIKEQAEKLYLKNKTIQQVKKWSALKEVAGMKGMVSQNQSNGYEAKLIEDIVESIRRKISYDNDLQFHKISWRRVYKSLVRLDAQQADIRAKLDSQMLQMWKRPNKEVGVWLGDVASLKADVQELEQEVFGESRAFSRVDLGKILDERIREAAELQERGRAFNDNLLVPFPLERPYTEARNAERIREYFRETLSVSVM